jgi:predicted nuclease of predicted toxin-antitoxin system
MAFAIKVDEDLPRSAVNFLREQGYDAVNVVEQRMGGWKDPALWNAIQEEKRFLVTADKGFADVRAFPPGKHAGILLLRPDEDGIRPVLELLQQVLKSSKLEDLTGTTTVASPRGIRIRKP